MLHVSASWPSSGTSKHEKYWKEAQLLSFFLLSLLYLDIPDNGGEAAT
jgi:hypothetical protein